MEIIAATRKQAKDRAEAIHLRRGLKLGKYRLDKRLGEGGYCEVWKARDTVEGIWVALKIPGADVYGMRDNQTVLREVRLVAQLRHKHIMPIKNAAIIDGHAVLATELSERTLADCYKPMSARRIISITAQVLEGLGYAHRKKLVHCDVTPGNIFLFPDGHAMIGDFGIGIEVRGRMKTVDDYGTPGYVAPEQAYGRPTYRSDCFSTGLILYQYLTGLLPGWPFKWPFKGHDRLKERTSTEFAAFIKKAVKVDPAKRFASANAMLAALKQATPKILQSNGAIVAAGTSKLSWKQIRRQAFIKRYKKIFPVVFPCAECGEPVAESMTVCPWCSSKRNRFDDCSSFDYICWRCHKGMLGNWHYCPWCYGAGFKPQDSDIAVPLSYHDRCTHCNGKVMRFMHYCPWCRRKVSYPWHVWPFPEVCGRCGWSVDSNFWNYCPWCRLRLIR